MMPIRKIRLFFAVWALLALGTSGARAVQITNLDAEAQTVTVTENGTRTNHQMEQGETITICESGCFVLFPSGTILPFAGDENVNIEQGEVVIK